MGDTVNLESGWNDLTEEITVPMDVGAAIATGRKELILIDRSRNSGDVQNLLHAFGVLIETNHKLKERGIKLAQQVINIQDNMKGVEKSLLKLRQYAEGTEIPEETD